MTEKNSTEGNPLSAAMHEMRGWFVSVGLFSLALNLLMLTGPLFMLQVYDRVLSSRSVPTLVALFSLVAILYLFLGLFDFTRSRILSRAGYRLDEALFAPAQSQWIASGTTHGENPQRPVGDLETIRQFLCSNGPPALFDLPWVPVYLCVVFLLHAWLGLLAAFGAVLVIAATLLNEWLTRRPLAEAAGFEIGDGSFSEAVKNDAEAIVAMGMVTHVSRHWRAMHRKALARAQAAGNRSEFIIAFTRATRLLVQSGILALGAWLTILEQLSAGAMIAASIIAGRALAPIDAAVANWRNLIRARQAFRRLLRAMDRHAGLSAPVLLPAPNGHLAVTGLTRMAGRAEKRRALVNNLQFSLQPGDGLGVIGASGSGKSSLAKLLIGLWAPDRGEIRLDGATFDQWDRDLLGRHVGYLPQSVDLLAATIRQNISRFDPTVTDDDVVAAASLAGCHDMILSLPDGYSTDLSLGKSILSGGQAQRVALARAVLRSPRLVVLDEPNASLDADGEAALINAVRLLRMGGSCVVIMAHRPSAMAAVNKVLMLKDGKQAAFGPKAEVLRQLTRIVPHKRTRVS